MSDQAGARASMSRRTLLLAVPAVLGGAVLMSVIRSDETSAPEASPGVSQPLPPPRPAGTLSLEEALALRRSVRSFTAEALTLTEIGQLLWAAQGRTDDAGYRTAPSAGALYPLEVDIATADGVARYLPDEHSVVPRAAEDARPALRKAALDQAAVGEAPLVVVVIGVVKRTAARYRAERAERYVALEAGHAAQNVLLEAVSLELGAVPIGAFDDAAVRRVLALAEGEAPLYLIPVGHPR